MDKLRIYNARWSSPSAGPSPNENRRAEIFLAGCKKAATGNACVGCFNVDLWKANVFNAEVSPEEAFQQIQKFAPTKHVTFVGGEPLDQAVPLARLAELLKADGFHNLLITHHTMKRLKKWIEDYPGGESYRILLNNVDIIIDGEYMAGERIWDESKAGDGVHDVIGSGNQIVWSRLPGEELKFQGVAARYLKNLSLKENGQLFYGIKDSHCPKETISIGQPKEYAA